MTTTEAQAIQHEMATFAQGLDLILEALAAQTAMLTAMHEELCKEPPPSKIPQALAELTEAIQSLEVVVRGEKQKESSDEKE